MKTIREDYILDIREIFDLNYAVVVTPPNRNSICTMKSLPDGSLFVGTVYGVFRLKDGLWESMPVSDLWLPAGSNDDSDWLIDGVTGYIVHGSESTWCTFSNGVICEMMGDMWSHRTTMNVLASKRVTDTEMDSDGNLWVGTQDMGIFRFDGTNWKHFALKDGLSGYNIFGISAGYGDGIWASVGGKELVHIIDDEIVEAYAIPRNYILFSLSDSGDQQLIGSFKGEVYEINNNSWKDIVLTGGNPPTRAIDATVTPHGEAWVATHNGLLKYTNSGITSYFVGEYSNHIYSVEIDADGIVWAGDNSGLKRFDGESWGEYTVDDGLKSQYIRQIKKAHDNTLWVTTSNYGYDYGTGTAYFFNIFDGKQWVNNDISSIGKINDFTLSESNILYSCFWITHKHYTKPDGLYYYPLNTQTTVTEQSTSVPSGLPLISNYPNPFNPSTTIEYTLTEPGETTFSIYDITGRKVREFVSGYTPAGRHSILWDGCDSRGRSVSSGIYITRLKTPKSTAAHTMLLLK